MQFVTDHPSIIVIIAAAISFLVTFILAPPVIRFLHKKKYGQSIREEGPESHKEKQGTPTMGGVVILAGLIAGTITSLVTFTILKPVVQFRLFDLMFSLALLALTIAFSSIGVIDDWGKIKRGRSLGLKAREKLVLQLVTAALFVGILSWGMHTSTTIGIPWLGEVEIGWWYWPFAILFITAFSNAVNLTDGLDGLASGTTVLAASALGVVAWFLQKGDSLKGPGISAFLVCLAAACLAFLWFNRHPAKVFMGDTGSLAIGAALAGAALAMKQEVILIVIGLIFLLEMFSVIIQVISYKLTGKRVFRMSPYHHHLELGGWSEVKIVTRAWWLGLLLALLGTITFFLLHR